MIWKWCGENFLHSNPPSPPLPGLFPVLTHCEAQCSRSLPSWRWTAFHKQRQHVKGSAGLEEGSKVLWGHVRRASAQTIGTFFLEETNGEHGLEPKVHTMGGKNPRPSGFIPVSSGTTHPVLVGVGPIHALLCLPCTGREGHALAK